MDPWRNERYADALRTFLKFMLLAYVAVTKKDPLLTAKDVAVLAEKDAATVRGWCENGQIRAKKLANNTWRIWASAWVDVEENGLAPLGTHQPEREFAA